MLTAAETGKKRQRGCLGLILAAAGFIAMVYGVMIACMTLQDNNTARENSLKQIASCTQPATVGQETIREYFDNESCRELLKQHAARFNDAR